MLRDNCSECATTAHTFVGGCCQQCSRSMCVPCHHIHCSRAHNTGVHTIRVLEARPHMFACTLMYPILTGCTQHPWLATRIGVLSLRRGNFSEGAITAHTFVAVCSQQCLRSVCVPCHHIHCNRAHTEEALRSRHVHLCGQ